MSQTPSQFPGRLIDGPRLPPAKGPARQLIVLLHGYGADGNDLIELASHWRRELPGAAFVAPNAPSLIPGTPQGPGFGGRQWFGLNDYDPNMLRRDPHRAGGIYEALLAGAEQAAPVIEAFLEAELARHNLPAAKLGLVGFSQGTMMALHVGLRRVAAPGAILGYSGVLVGAAKLPEQARGKPPVLLVHGSADDVVPMEALFDTLNGLGAADIPARWHLSLGVPHAIDPEGLRLGGHFLAQTL